MTLQASGAITIAQINAEFGLGNNLNAYRGVTWYTDAGGTGTFSSGALSMNAFYSKRATSPGGTFSPDGGTSSGSRVSLVEAFSAQSVSRTISCSQTASWTWVRTSGTAGNGSAGATTAASGTAVSDTEITFTLSGGTLGRTSQWTCDATSGSNTRYWTVTLTADGNGGCSTCCFTPDTLITMADGSSKPIVDIEVGDLILCQDAATGVNVITAVTGILTRIDRAMYEFRFANGTVLNASEDHPLFALGKGWASVGGFGDYKDLGTVQAIAVGDRVIGFDGTSSEILSIEQIDFPGTVYTLDNSRFYANGVLVY